MPVWLIPLGIFLSGLLATALVRILAGAGITWIFISGVDVLIENIVAQADIGTLPAWAVEHAARIGVFEIINILIGAYIFAFTIRQFNFLRRSFPA